MEAPEPTPAEAAQAVYQAAGIDTATGFAVVADYPANGRLRAEALADAGEATDPAGIVSDDLIASTADRLARDRAEAERLAAAEAKAHPPVKPSMPKPDLVAIASKEGVAVNDDDTRETIVTNIEAARAAETQEG